MADVKRNDSVDATTQDARTFRQASERGVVHDSGAHWHTRVRDNTAPVNSFTAKTWTKVLSVCLSFLLAFMMFDATAFPSYANGVNDEATPLAESGEGEGESEAIEDGIAKDDVEAEDAEDQAARMAWAKSAQEQPIDPADLEALLPSDLINVEDVCPTVTADVVAAENPDAAVDADIASRISPVLRTWGAPLKVDSGFYVRGQRLSAVYDLGNLSDLLEGGYVAGSREGDRFVLTMDVPFLYLDDSGKVAKTFSEEEWRLRTALVDEASVAGSDEGAATYEEAFDRALETAKDASAASGAMRAALFADKVPQDWAIWQEHAGAYARITDEALQEGVSGRLVFVYEGNGGKLTADAVLPAFEMGFVGDVPADAAIDVHYGYEAHSFTGRLQSNGAEPPTTYGDAKRASLGSCTLVNESQALDASLSAEVQGAPSMVRSADGSSQGWLSLVAHYDMGEQSARAWALGAYVRADWADRGGLTLAQLAAFLYSDGEATANVDDDGAPRISPDFLEESTFVGVPGQGGVVALDVTDLSEDQIASINPADGKTLEALGLEPLPYTVSEAGQVRVVSEEGSGSIEAHRSRLIYLAIPYAESALTRNEKGDAFEPVAVQLDMQVGLTAKGVSFVHAQPVDLQASFAMTVPPESSDETASDDASGSSGTSQKTGDEVPNPSGTDGLEGQESTVGSNEDDATGGDAEFDAERSQALVDRMNETGSGPVVFANALSLAAMPLFSRSLGASTFAAGGGEETILVGGLPAGYIDPNLKVTPGGGTAMGNNTYMIKSTDSPFIDLTADIGYDAGFMGLPATGYADGEREDAAPVFELQIPYFVPSGSAGGLTEEYNFDKWGNQIGSDTSERGPRLALVLNSDCFNGKWKIYDMDRSGSTKGTEVTEAWYKRNYNSEGITGIFRFKYMGNAANKWQLIKDFSRLSLGVTFIGAIPENTGGTIRWGVTYNSYTDANGNVTRGNIDTVISPGAQSDSSTQRNATFIKTNLDWHTNVEVLNKPVLWDRYNYMVYRVTTRNVSPEVDSQIDYLSYFFKFPSAELTNTGIRDADLVTWLVTNPRTDKETITRNTDPRATLSGKEYVGVPGQGGALIYDITNNPGVVNSLDLQSFENAEELGLHELPYTTAGMNGQISFTVPELKKEETIDPNDESGSEDYDPLMGGSMYYGPLKKPTIAGDQKTDRKVFLLALPYTTNMSPEDYVTLDTESTVHFGGRGVDDYMWTKTYANTSMFDTPTAGATIEKTALNIDTGAEGERQTAPLGHSVTYRLKNFRITGNQPLFGTSLADNYGAQIVDTLPSGLNLQQISLRINESAASRPDSTDPNSGKQPLVLSVGDVLNGTTLEAATPVPDAVVASDWFAAERDNHGDSGVLEFEYRDRLGQVKWKTIDNLPLTRTYTSGSTDTIVYTFGNASDASQHLSTILEANGIGAIPRANGGVTAGSNGTFTGRVRFLMNQRIPQYRGLSVIPVTFEITGALITPRSNGAGGLFTNSASIAFGQKQWVTSSSEGGQYYTLISRTSAPDTASFEATPTNPKIVGGAFSGNNGGVGNVADLKETLVNEPNAGWRFHISNDSAAPMEPAYLLVGADQTPAGAVAGTVYPGMFYEGVRGVRRGFEAEKVTIGGNMFDYGTISSVEINYYSKNANDMLMRTTTLTAAQLQAYRDNDVDGDGLNDAVLPSSLWGDQYLMNVKVRFSSFRPRYQYAGTSTWARGTIEIIGTPNQVLSMPLKALWTTDYDDASYNKSATKTATLKSAYVPIKPAVAVNYGWGGNGLAATNATTNASGTGASSPSVPYRWGDGAGEETYFNYRFTNDSFFTARRLNLDLQINDNAASSMAVTTDEDGSTLQRGFVGEELVLPGFEWNTYTTSVERPMPETEGTTPDGAQVTLNKRNDNGDIAFNIDIDNDGVADFLIDANNDGVVDDPDDVYQFSPIYDEIDHTGWLHKSAAISAVDFFSANINGEAAKTSAAQAAAEEAARQMSYDAVELQNFIFLDKQDGSGKGDGPQISTDRVTGVTTKADNRISSTTSGANTIEVWEHMTTDT